MFPFPGKKQDHKLAGIVTGASGTAVASVEWHGQETPVLQACNFTNLNHADENALDGLGLNSQPCSSLLAVDDYQLLVVDAPEVPADEIAAAIRWRIRDMIDFHIDDAVLDIFDAPPAGPANSKQLYVVVTREETVRQHIDKLEAAGVRLEYIDIPELAMRNIAARLPGDEAGMVSLYFSEDQCLITITHNAELYLTRRIDIGYRQVQEEAANPQSLCNRLALEIQRSMDYYEHNYHQAAVRSITIFPVPVSLYGLPDALQMSLGLEVQAIGVEDIVDSPVTPDEAHAAECLLAVGSALRNEEVTL